MSSAAFMRRVIVSGTQTATQPAVVVAKKTGAPQNRGFATPIPAYMIAIPDFTYTTNAITVGGEPATWQAVATGQPIALMNGTYSTTGSHFWVGDYSDVPGYFNSSGTIKSFKRNLPFGNSGWLSRTASNNYAADGHYQGSTQTTISGTAVPGEYMTITAPYSFSMTSYTIVSGNKGIPIAAWTIGGSTDGGTTYTTVDTQTNISMPGRTATIQLPSNTTAYSTYIIVVTANSSSGGANGANIDSWNLYTQFSS